MASIKKLDTRKFKITVSNGYRPDGRKISRVKTITVPDSVHSCSIHQYVAHEAEEFERIKWASQVLTKEELNAREQALKKEKEGILVTHLPSCVLGGRVAE